MADFRGKKHDQLFSLIFALSDKLRANISFNPEQLFIKLLSQQYFGVLKNLAKGSN